VKITFQSGEGGFSSFSSLQNPGVQTIFRQSFMQMFQTRTYRLRISGAVLLWLVSLTGAAQGAFTSSNLPIIMIETGGYDIPYDNPRLVADMGVIDNGPGLRNSITDTFNNYNGKISIEIHGQSSAGWSKKSYSFETQNPDGTNNNVRLLGFPPENDWILYAPYYDRSFLRNVLTFHLTRQMGWYASRTRYCELVLNGDYRGIYVLMEKIKRDSNRVDIAKLTNRDISGDDVTGGYILKVDKDDWKPGIDSEYPPYSGASQTIRYQYVYPKADKLLPQQEYYIKNFIGAFEFTVNSENFNDPVSGYPKYLNIPSFADNFIINELSRNVDGYRLSSYFYKDKDSKGGKLTAGPVWDYNFSFGNVGYYNSQYTEGWQLEYFLNDDGFKNDDGFQLPFWWRKLLYDSAFVQKIIDRWQALRTQVITNENIVQFIDAVADTLDEAKNRNFQIWPGPGEPKLPEDGWFPPMDPIADLHTYADEINYLETWISSRIDWIDQNIGLLLNTAKPPPQTYGFFLGQNLPNPVVYETTIRYQIPSHLHVTLNIYNIFGEKVAILVDAFQERGEYFVNWKPVDVANGVYIYEIRAGDFRLTRKLLLQK